jgi:hypothetical protein
MAASLSKLRPRAPLFARGSPIPGLREFYPPPLKGGKPRNLVAFPAVSRIRQQLP